MYISHEWGRCYDQIGISLAPVCDVLGVALCVVLLCVNQCYVSVYSICTVQ